MSSRLGDGHLCSGAGSGTDKPVNLKIRALVIDGRVKEYAVGAPHEVTERLFVVRRAFRVNDSFPQDPAPRWQWERGGWLLVDRLTGHVSPINLPEFDVLYSSASWYRDYVAYCGVSDDGKKTYAMVAQISRRKPVLKSCCWRKASLRARLLTRPVRHHRGSVDRCGSVLSQRGARNRRS
jgi:hypothetical protein